MNRHYLLVLVSILLTVFVGCSRSARDLKRKAAQGDVEAMVQLAASHRSGSKWDIAKDPQRAFELMKKAAEQNYAPAMCLLSGFYEDGIGTPVDKSAAFYWLLESAERGYVLAQFGVAVYYEDGIGIERDIDLAIHWYEIAAANGDTDAQQRLDRLSQE